MNEPKIVVPEISFDSEVFDETRSLIDIALANLLAKVYKGEFESGDLNIKISLSILDDYTKLPGEDPLTGDTIETMYEYRRPCIDSAISTTLKKVAKLKASYAPELEIKEHDGAFVIQELPKTQISIDDFEF
ncbi:hypothetical protein KCG48_05050 [Proteiniclasticum sp. BAD-10]|uniref:Uncharacterized protein n=1 Tax=Proteiniclasticum sediminis TaxID=2804028 RepID=A0A941CQ28_9CLOT|nr:hypothetical protein [Proteiniclasticum sediminis]MBR0575708.1 hypothetical protein [Proteiniclasticum sediminis]